MDSAIREKINDAVDTLVECFEIEIPIKNIEYVVTGLGGTFIRKDINIKGFSCHLYKNDDAFTIEVSGTYNDNKSEVLAIAEQIGHLFLHMGYLIDKEMWKKCENNECFREEIGEMQYQAYEFAMALLMPRKLFFEKIRECYIGDGKYNIEPLPNFFNVPIGAIERRGQYYGIFSWM